jgi:hypothetical protein
MTTETGGPAFPHTVEYKGADCGGVVPHGGMTLRDYFAAKAMEAHVVRADVWDAISKEKINPEKICSACYAWADMMLKARGK